MKIAVVGKGGSGKTTTAAVVARGLARRGVTVVALDCDTNPNLGLSLGVGAEETERLVAMRQRLDEGDGEHAPGWDDLLERFGSDGPDGVRFAVVSQIENPEPGCPCCGLSPEQMLGHVELGGATVVADLEAGIGTLTRLDDDSVELALVVVEPTPKSTEVARRAVELARDKGVGHIVVIANRVRSDEDRQLIARALDGAEVIEVPDDDAVVEADRRGVAPLDLSPDAPAVAALLALADDLANRAATVP
ncbi:AAA family ATPase [Iamia sp.]|uniref:ATP-binding protein n=1 Tax=Iamia sp. TaxID=2722710 RepID=UPI002B878E52|nr:AAA family ATPase [Iamia sp.]HXH58900.1 AAA family ATPase [Iamia sp.]